MRRALALPGLVVLLGGMLGTVGSGSHAPPVSSDSTGAQIDLQRDGGMLRVRGLFLGDARSSDTLAYELTVRRSGAAGTSQTAQSGTFAVTPGQTDTLSTVQVSVQTGDQVHLRLVVRAGRQPIDTARVARTVS